MNATTTDSPRVRDGELSAFQEDILYAIAGYESQYYTPDGALALGRSVDHDVGDGDPRPYGLAIKSILEDRYGERVYHGRLYPNLNELEDKGLIRSGKFDERTNWYSLTQAGHNYLQRRQKWQTACLQGGDQS
ncbi:helix-turn-helix transcriptional regulator [Halobacteriaceae archaeon GCM10025711]